MVNAGTRVASVRPTSAKSPTRRIAGASASRPVPFEPGRWRGLRTIRGITVRPCWWRGARGAGVSDRSGTVVRVTRICAAWRVRNGACARVAAAAGVALHSASTPNRAARRHMTRARFMMSRVRPAIPDRNT